MNGVVMNTIGTLKSRRNHCGWTGFFTAVLAGALILGGAAQGWAAPEFETLQSFAYNSTNIGELSNFFQTCTPVLVGDTLYGTTMVQGYGYGTVFSINTNGTDFKVLHEFSPEVLPNTTNYDG